MPAFSGWLRRRAPDRSRCGSRRVAAPSWEPRSARRTSATGTARAAALTPGLSVRVLLLRGSLLERTVGEPLAQDLLVELADARLRHLVDEGERLGQPPLHHALGQVG